MELQNKESRELIAGLLTTLIDKINDVSFNIIGELSLGEVCYGFNKDDMNDLLFVTGRIDGVTILRNRIVDYLNTLIEQCAE